jgi:toxin HigB-1
MLDARRIRHKGLKLLYARGDGRHLNAEWVGKLKRILAALNVATMPSEMELPGYRLHELRGDREGTFSVTVRANWRVTFKWNELGPYDVDLEDYHGR